jgi:hypothetical protein
MNDWKAEEARARERVIPLLALAVTGLLLFAAGLIIPCVKRDFYEVYGIHSSFIMLIV